MLQNACLVKRTRELDHMHHHQDPDIQVSLVNLLFQSYRLKVICCWCI